MCGIVLLGATIGAARTIWDTRKLFVEAKQDTDAIQKIRDDLQKQKDALDLLVRDSNSAYKEIAAVRIIAVKATSQIESLGRLVQEAAASLDRAQFELRRLKDRNDLAALADEAISEGSVKAYKKLLDGRLKARSDEERRAIDAEEFRVIAAYSPGAPTRTGSMKINVRVLNPMKQKEDELTADDIMPFMSITVESNAIIRAKLAELLISKAKYGSYKTAESLIYAIRHEDHLESIKNLLQAFRRVTGYNNGDKPDGRLTLGWWDDNWRSIKEKDSDRASGN